MVETSERPGSFMLPKHQFDQSIRVMPTDPLTGLPYPIIPVVLKPKMPRDCDTNYHHHFYFRTDPDLEGDLGVNGFMVRSPEEIPLDLISGLAVRMSRGQLLSVGTHDEIHQRFRAGPELPRTQQDKFRIAALACAGVISQYGLDFSRPNGKELVRMNDEQTAYMSSGAALLTEKQHFDRAAQHRRAVIGSFFLRYAVSQDLSHITPRVVDEFLNTQNPVRRIELGSLILSQAVELSIEPILPMYTELSDLGIVPHARPRLRESVKKLIRARSARRIVDELASNIDGSLVVA